MSESLDAWPDPGTHRTPDDIITTARCQTPTGTFNGAFGPMFSLDSDHDLDGHQPDVHFHSTDCFSEDTLSAEHAEDKFGVP